MYSKNLKKYLWNKRKNTILLIKNIDEINSILESYYLKINKCNISYL